MTTFISARPVQPCTRFNQLRPHRTSDCNVPTLRSLSRLPWLDLRLSNYTRKNNHVIPLGAAAMKAAIWQFGDSAVALHATGQFGKLGKLSDTRSDSQTDT